MRAPTFKELYATDHEVVALLTSPQRIGREKQPLPASPVRAVAERHGTSILEPENVNDPEVQAQLTKLNADLMVVCDYGQILNASTLAATALGGVNLHASLLPKYRGAAPINWAIFNGETRTGVTVIHMTPQIDAGPCIAQAEIEIGTEETAVELEKRLAELGARLVVCTIDALAVGKLQALPQDPALASKAPRLKKTDGLIDWSRSAVAIKNQIRALEPWPKTYTFWHRQKGPPVRLIFGPVDVEDHAEFGSAAPGTVLEASAGRLLIAAGKSAVAPRSVQPVGKRLMSVDEFLRGHKVRPGDRFGAD